MKNLRDRISARLVWWSLAASLLIHVVVLYVRLDRTAPQPPTNWSQPIEVSEMDPALLESLKETTPPSKDLKIVESEKAGKEEIDPDAKFLSDKNQKVEVETRAKNVDDFRKAEGSGLGGNQSGLAQPGEPEAPEEEPTQISDLEVDDSDPNKPNNKGTVRDWRNLTLKDLSVGGRGGIAGATDDLLDDIRAGDRTVLSTREFQYFSYYHRIKELLRQFWKPNVERKLLSVWNKGKNLKQSEMTTKLLVLLDTSGKIQEISRVTSSGIEEIDDAAIEAFKQAGPFPNPPKGIVDADGFVRIRWDFILKAEASPAIQWRQVGNAGP